MFDKVKCVWSKTNRFIRIILLFVLVESHILPRGRVGFYCDDPALSHPYNGDTVTWKWLFSMSLLFPLAVLLVVERIWHEDEDPQKAGRAKKQALRWYKEYTYGFLVNVTMVEVLKSIVGSPRPHFFDTCGPEEALTCVSGEYISQYRCKLAGWETQSDRSFPSGHSSLGLHAAVFVSYYLHRRLSQRVGARALVPWHVGCACAAAFCAWSRMLDNRHHWWDVLAGLVIGVVVLIYTILSLCKNFECVCDAVGSSEQAVGSGTEPLLESESAVKSTQ